MEDYDILVRNALIVDGSGEIPFVGDLAVKEDRIEAIGNLNTASANIVLDGRNKVLSPGFIDVHSHDDISVILSPEMIPKISQGVTTIVVGNCGISASPVTLKNILPDPMNLLGTISDFQYAEFTDYVDAISRIRPAVNVAAFVGHTSLRNNHMSTLNRAASDDEINAMKSQLKKALSTGALGLSTGLAYASAIHAPTGEIKKLAEELTEFNGIYATHMRSEADTILQAIDETLEIGTHAKVPVIISHLKCAGKSNWNRAEEVLNLLQNYRLNHPLGWDCYPYTASSSTLDLKQVTNDYNINITWSNSNEDIKHGLLSDIARAWEVDIFSAAKRLQPAGAIYHNMSENDMQMILRHPATMIGSDGLPNDPYPHPRLWGTFPRILSHCCRNLNLFSLQTAVHKMTGLPARRFGWNDRGILREGYIADMVLFDFASVQDTADYKNSQKKATGIEAVFVNGVLVYRDHEVCGERNGRFLPRGKFQNCIPY